MINYYNVINDKLTASGIILISPDNNIINRNDKLVIEKDGYKRIANAKSIIQSKSNTIKFNIFEDRNPYIIDNINNYFRLNREGNFICLSTYDEYENKDTELTFKCVRCGSIIKKQLKNAIRNEDDHHNGLTCLNCDGRTESLHALVLKQLFMHYYPDTIVEEKSCINPETGCIMATDIVNHRLKIAIEVQGQWHKYESQKKRDAIKKQFWLDKGYAFYDYEIDKVSVLDYARYFFPDLDEIPSWVNMEYSNKINIVKIQQMLDDGMKVPAIAEELNISPHRIYDAFQYGKLHYPDDYSKCKRRPIVQLSMHKEYITEYGSYADASRANNIDISGIISCVHTKSYYSNGYYWIPKDLYDTGNYYIPTNRLDKFYKKVNKIDNNGNIVATFDNFYEASKDVGTIAYKIYEVASGYKKTTKGFHYEFA